MSPLFEEHYRKKRRARRLALGSLVVLAVVVWWFWPKHLPQTADYLPANKTAAYIEIPNSISSKGQKLIQELSGISVDTPMLVSLADSLALAYIEGDGVSDPEPILFVTPSSEKDSQKTLVDFFSNQKKFVYSNDKFVIVSGNENAKPIIEGLIAQAPSESLSELSEFGEARENALNTDTEAETSNNNSALPYFAFGQPKIDPAFFLSLYEENAPSIPLTKILPDTFAAHFIVNDDGALRGTLITAHERRVFNRPPVFGVTEQPYHAFALPLLPIDPDGFVGGASLSAMIDYALDTSSVAFTKLMETYFPGLEYWRDIEPLTQGEFGYAVKKMANFEGFVATIHLNTNAQDSANLLSKITNSFADGMKRRAYKEVSFTLQDGTEAEERVHAPEIVKQAQEELSGTQVWSVSGNFETYYVALSNDTLFVANDHALISQALSQAKDGGISLRDGDLYKIGLQPILKNPQLTGATRVTFSPKFKGVMSFSKRRLPTTTETQFQFIFD